MAAWFTAVAPFLPDIIQMAKPIFTRARDPDKTPDLVPQQITELQDAAAQNADAVHKLAEEMQSTLGSLQKGSLELERQSQDLQRAIDRANRLALVAATVAVLAFALATYSLAT